MIALLTLVVVMLIGTAYLIGEWRGRRREKMLLEWDNEWLEEQNRELKRDLEKMVNHTDGAL